MVGSRVGRRFILHWVDGSLLSLCVVLEIYAYEMFFFVRGYFHEETCAGKDERRPLCLERQGDRCCGEECGVALASRLCSGNARMKN